MKKLLQISLLFLFASSALAQETSAPKEKVLRVYNWNDLKVQSTNANCQIISMDGMSVLKIEHTNASLSTISLLKITNSTDIQKASWMADEIKYDMTNGNALYQIEEGYELVANALVLRNEFAPAAMGGDKRIWISSSGNIDGKLNWRPFRLVVRNLDGKPEQMELRLFLSTPGTIYLRPIKLLGFASSSNWWTPEQGGMIGGIGGTIIGCFGALIGILTSKGNARKFVLALTKICIVLGIFLLLAGAIATATKQPYAVYYPLLLAGFILTIVFSVNLPSIQRRYDELEIRRMTSVDTMES
jgi:hypothetical protein